MNAEQSEWLAAVSPLYDEPPRAYHTARHLRTVLTQLQHRSRTRGFVDIPRPLFFAALYHDAIYDPRRKDNEERSADLCRRALTDARIEKRIVERAVALILTTQTHLPLDARFDARALLDADLWVLGADWDEYCLYAARIRQEYSHVSDDAFRSGRCAVLARFLTRSVLYFGDGAAVKQREERARQNLRAELDYLQA